MPSSKSPVTTPKARPSTIPSPDAGTSGSPSWSSPLKSLFTPKKSLAELPSSPPDSNNFPSNHQNPADIIHEDIEESTNLQPLSMTLSHPGHGEYSISLPDIDLHDDNLRSTFRERSRSPTRRNAPPESTLTESKLATSWWGHGENHVTRPWDEGPRRQRTVPAEHHLAREETRKRVAQAVASVLGTTADVAHEVLFVGVELLDLVPIPGLSVAAKTLLNIWDAAQFVDMNRLGSLRLTERCADLLISVREEVNGAGDEVTQELMSPIAKLEESFIHVYRFMIKQAKRPWLKRYLKRDEILRDIAECDSTLRDALGQFNASVQIRILKQVLAAEKRRELATREILSAIANGNEPHLMSELPAIIESGEEVASPELEPYLLSTRLSSTTVTDFVTTRNALGLMDKERSSSSSIPDSGIISELETLHTVQNSLDAAHDTSDLRQLMRTALHTSSDAEMLEVLQIGRREMPDAIKTLQRALERLSDRDDSRSSDPNIVTGQIIRRASVQEGEESGPEGADLKRSDTIISISTSTSSSGSSRGNNSDQPRKDTLDREFVEMGIDCLRRMSQGAETTVPPWTITKYEVDRDVKIGYGFFSDVYKGTWEGKAVAIKVLAETTPRNLFVREMAIWKKLHHPNILPLYGASSATGDAPWFLVSPYLKNGTLVEHLKRIDSESAPITTHILGHRSVSLPNSSFSKGRSPDTRPSMDLTANNLTPPARQRRFLSYDNDIPRQRDLFRFMHEIAKGMEYLHTNGVLHGDLKASNVLVDDRYRCVISDFGQSEMKNEAFRTSGIPPPQGTLRWQSPEFMSGQSQLTPAVDIWAFSISCVEILTMGKMPWPGMDDHSVRYFVLEKNYRPAIPRASQFNIPRLQAILRDCWQTNPTKRPSFTEIAKSLRILRKSFGQEPNESPNTTPIEDPPEHPPSPSPDMRPMDNLPAFIQTQGADPWHSPDVLIDSLALADAVSSTVERPTVASDVFHRESTVATMGMKFPEPVIFTPDTSRSSSFHMFDDRQDHIVIHHDDGYVSPPPIDERAAQMKHERKYRLHLTHDYHPSLTLPLWDPSPVELGSVGYHSKPAGKFITLFNAYNPRQSDNHRVQSLPSIYGYGMVKDGVQRLPKKSVTQKALDIIAGSLTFRNTSETIVRRPSFPLKVGHTAAHMYTEVTEYRYMETLEAPRMWFQANVNPILEIYGRQHRIAREDLFLIIGTLRAPDWAIMVSHIHPEGHAHFNVYSSPQLGKPWGTFTTDNEVPRRLGPSYPLEDSPESTRLNASKVSMYGGPWDALLLARLRFKPDVLEPTSK